VECWIIFGTHEKSAKKRSPAMGDPGLRSGLGGLSLM
jgi:hypothetical protein